VCVCVFGNIFRVCVDGANLWTIYQVRMSTFGRGDKLSSCVMRAHASITGLWFRACTTTDGSTRRRRGQRKRLVDGIGNLYTFGCNWSSACYHDTRATHSAFAVHRVRMGRCFVVVRIVLTCQASAAANKSLHLTH